MAAMSRTKGKVGERELAALIRELTGWPVCRRVRQHDGDSDLEGVPGWSVEVKRYARAPRSNVAAWWAQAVAQAARAGCLPVLFYRADRDAWRAVWPLGIHLGADWREYGMTCEGSVEAWSAVACDGAKGEETGAKVPASTMACTGLPKEKAPVSKAAYSVAT